MIESDTIPRHRIGEQLTGTVSDIAFGGEGVVRADEFVVFVPFVLMGEEIRFELTEVKKRFGRGKLLEVIRAAPERVEPPCPYFGLCGGCQYQHIDYPAQLLLKHKQISDLFQRIGGIDPAVLAPIVPCPKPYGYRNRIMIRTQWDKTIQGLHIGFLQAESRHVVDVDECKIAEPALSAKIAEVRRNPPPKGGLKVVLRLPPENWQVPGDSFFQNNFLLLPELVRVTRETLQGSGSRFLADLYCGVGFFGISLGDLVERFMGVEVDKPAIAAARANAARQSRTNGEFISARSEDILPAVWGRFPPAETTILLDPPRTGCPKEFLEQLRAAGPRQIIYISCHPATLARDLNVLTQDGVFGVERVTPLDMFPQTQHVECVADIRRRL